MVAEALILILVELGLMVIILAVTQVEECATRFPYGEGNCHRCGYSLCGLPWSTRCPECGYSDPGEAVEYVKRHVINLDILSRIGLVLVLTILGAGGLQAAFLTALRWSYALQLGYYNSDVIANAIRVRPSDLPYAGSLFPFSVGIMICTICTAKRTAFPFKPFAWGTIMIAWSISVAWLFLSTYIQFA